MTQDEIIAMARKAGMNANVGHEVNGAHLPAIAAIRSSVPVEWLQRFAALVAAAEREACALACEAIETRTWAVYKGSMDFAGESGRADSRVYGMSDGASECATAIRARSTNGS